MTDSAAKKPAAGRKYTRRADWEMIEAAYRLNKLSIRTIATEHGITEGAIRKRAKAELWTRDLAIRVRNRSDSLVRKALAIVVKKNGAPSAPTDDLIGDVLEVEIEAMVQARIRISHRADIARSRGLVMSLLGELDACMTIPEGKKEHAALLPLVVRVTSMKSLADSLRVLIDCERKAFGLDDAVATALSFEDRLKAIANG